MCLLCADRRCVDLTQDPQCFACSGLLAPLRVSPTSPLLLPFYALTVQALPRAGVASHPPSSTSGSRALP